MAGPIRISVLADVRDAVSNMSNFADRTTDGVQRVVTSLGDSHLHGSMGKLQEGFDVLDTRAMGFRDTVTGVQDTMTGVQALFGQGEAASKSLGDKFLMLGMGIGDLASGMANFIVPLMQVGLGLSAAAAGSEMSTVSFVAHKVATAASAVASGVMTAAQWALNAAMSANPLALVVIAIVALVAAIVIAYNKSETFRAIVQAVWAAIKAAVSSVVSWFTANIPKLWDAAQDVWNKTKAGAEAVWNAVKTVVSSVVSAITGTVHSFGSAASAVWSAIRSAASSAWSAISGVVKGAVDKVVGFVTGLKSSIGGAFSGAASMLWNAGSQIIEGLWSGLKAKWESVKAWFSSVTSSIKDLKGPPSKDSELLRRNGQLVIEGFIGGLESRYGVVRDSLRGLTTDVGMGGPGASAAPTAGGMNVTSNVFLDGQPFYAMTQAAVRQGAAKARWDNYAGRRYA